VLSKIVLSPLGYGRETGSFDAAGVYRDAGVANLQAIFCRVFRFIIAGLVVFYIHIDPAYAGMIPHGIVIFGHNYQSCTCSKHSGSDGGLPTSGHRSLKGWPGSRDGLYSHFIVNSCSHGRGFSGVCKHDLDLNAGTWIDTAAFTNSVTKFFALKASESEPRSKLGTRHVSRMLEGIACKPETGVRLTQGKPYQNDTYKRKDRAAARDPIRPYCQARCFFGSDSSAPLSAQIGAFVVWMLIAGVGIITGIWSILESERLRLGRSLLIAGLSLPILIGWWTSPCKN